MCNMDCFNCTHDDCINDEPEPIVRHEKSTYRREAYLKRKARGYKQVKTEEQKEASKITRRRYYEKNKERAILQTRLWQKQNKEYLNAKLRKHYAENREECLAKSKKWREQNPDKIAQYNANRKAKREALKCALPSQTVLPVHSPIASEVQAQCQ
jgi:hypothetical protein